MIAAVLRDMVVKVEDVSDQTAIVRNLGRENLSQSYVGGQGYVSTPSAFVRPNDLEAVACFDPEECEPLADWVIAMQEVDALADDESPATAAAIEIEENARLAMISFLHSHSLARSTPVDEISTNSPLSPAEDFYVERRIGYENLHPQRMALHGQSGEGWGRRRDAESDN